MFLTDVVGTMVAVFAVLIVISIAVPSIIVIRHVRRVRRANRVAPGRATAAPLWWMWAPGPAALLHRRLRSATAAGRYAIATCGPDPVGPLADALRELESVATMLDDGVVAAARLPRAARNDALRSLHLEVAVVEDTAQQLIATAGRFATDGTATPAARLAAVHERLRMIDLAVDEVRALESHRRD